LTFQGGRFLKRIMDFDPTEAGTLKKARKLEQGTHKPFFKLPKLPNPMKPLQKLHRSLKKSLKAAAPVYYSTSIFVNSVAVTTGVIDGALNAPDVFECKNNLFYLNYNVTGMADAIDDANLDGGMFYGTNIIRLWYYTSWHCYQTEQ
jgi:hypothetical protein